MQKFKLKVTRKNGEERIVTVYLDDIPQPCLSSRATPSYWKHTYAKNTIQAEGSGKRNFGTGHWMKLLKMAVIMWTNLHTGIFHLTI